MSMLRRILLRAGWLACAVALVPASLAVAQAPAVPLARPTFSVLHAFDDSGSGLDFPSVTPSGDGGYAGTLANGGAFGFGMVYKLSADGSMTTLHDFTGGADGALPGGVIADGQGNLYGATQQGGNQGCFIGSCGVIYEVTPDGRQTVLYAFASGAMGWAPTGELTRDADGNLYGATTLGGDIACPAQTLGCGVVFKLAPDGSYTVLYAFTGRADGAFPNGNLLRDRAGNLYGTTESYAPSNADACQTVADVSCGTVFRITPDGSYTRLHVFGDFTGGLFPTGTSHTVGLVGDSEGNIYGATTYGGVNPDNLCPTSNPVEFPGGCGVVFKLGPGGAYSVLYAFQGGNDGLYPAGSLYRNPQGGGLYGTAYYYTYGTQYCRHYHQCGLVFKVMPDGSKQTVYIFSDGFQANSTPLIKGQGAQLVGITGQGTQETATAYSLQFQSRQ